MKALRKEPVERYGSAKDMLADIERYKNNIPVHAKKGTLAYRSKKFLKRNRVGLSASLLFILAVTIFTGYHIQEISKERNNAQSEARKAQLVTDYIVDIFASPDPVQNISDTLNVYDLLNRGKDRISNMDDQPDLQIDLLLALGNSFVNIGNYEEAEQLFLKADSLASSLYSSQDYHVANTALFLGMLYRTRRDFELSENYYRKAKKVFDELELNNWQKKSIAYSGLGSTLLELGKADSAEIVLQKALSLEVENRATRTEILNTKLELARAYRAQNKYLKAENQYKEILRELERLETPNNTLFPTVLNNLAYLLRLQNRFAEAEAYYRRSLSLYNEIYGEDHPASLMILNNLSSVLQLQGKNKETEDYLKRKLVLTKKRYGTHWRTSAAIGSLGIFYLKLKDYEIAKAHFEQSNEMYKEVLNQYHTWTGISNIYWYICRKNLGDEIVTFKETNGYKILDYNRPYFSNYDSILVAQLLDYATEFSEADVTTETTILKEILERKN